ncbi:MAG: DUF58 domain-containing protein [Myxococcota bacterium]
MHPTRDPGTDERPAVAKRALAPRSYFQRARRWLEPPRRLRPTRAGWTFFALTFGIGFAALNTGNNLLYLVLALMLAFLVLSGVLSESALRGVAVRRILPRELGAEADAWVRLEIHNQQKRVAAYALAVEDRVRTETGEETAGRCFALRVDPGTHEVRSYRLRPEQRGELEFLGFVVFTRFPFGLFSKALTLDAPERALVYPAVDPVQLPARRIGVAESGEHAMPRTGAGDEVEGLREFAAGDALRRIEWRTSLRSRALWVRDAQERDAGEVEVRLHTASRAPGDAFERDVRSSASEICALLEDGLRVGLRTDHDRLDAAEGPGQRQRLLAFLARVSPAGASA